MSKRRIAVLISLMLAAPAAVVAVEQATVFAPAEAAAEAPSAETAEPAAQPVAKSGAPAETVSPVDGLVRATPSDAFPRGSDVEWERVPAAAAYLEQLERERSHLVARGDSFPTGTLGDDYYQPLPAQVAYFEQRERDRLASRQPASREPAPVAATPAGESRNPVKAAADYVSELLRPDGAATAPENTASAGIAK